MDARLGCGRLKNLLPPTEADGGLGIVRVRNLREGFIWVETLGAVVEVVMLDGESLLRNKLDGGLGQDRPRSL